MQFYFAPMEGITGYVYRNAFETVFAGIDKYFSPFIVPHRNRGFKTKELKDILPENNEKIHLVPQILTNDTEDFLRTAKEFQRLGYTEVNLNLGCPSGTVTAKGKGAGFLADPEKLDCFLEEIYDKSDVKISIKTRIGVAEKEEFSDLMEIYKKYPVSELIVHPRLLKDYYKNTPDLEVFMQMAKDYKGNIFYNGDIMDVAGYTKVMEQNPNVTGVMIGRGLLRNPALIREITGGKSVTVAELKEFHERLLEGYIEILSGDRNVLFRMKEVWFYLIQLFDHHEKYAKQIRKAQTVQEYRRIVESIFANLPLLVYNGLSDEMF